MPGAESSNDVSAFCASSLAQPTRPLLRLALQNPRTAMRGSPLDAAGPACPGCAPSMVSSAGFKLPAALLAATRGVLVDTSFLSSSPVGMLLFARFHSSSTAASPTSRRDPAGTHLGPTSAGQVRGARGCGRGGAAGSSPARPAPRDAPGPSGWVGSRGG